MIFRYERDRNSKLGLLKCVEISTITCADLELCKAALVESIVSASSILKTPLSLHTRRTAATLKHKSVFDDGLGLDESLRRMIVIQFDHK